MSTATAFDKTFSEFEFHPVIDAPCETSHHRLDDIVLRLGRGKKLFAGLSIDERLQLIDSFQKGYLNVAKRSVQASCAAKGIEFGTPTEGEEWASGPLCVIRHLRLLKESLEQIKKTGTTTINKPVHLTTQQLSIPVFPNSLVDSCLFKDVNVEMRLQKHVTKADLEENRASFYRKKNHGGKLVLILGAGNLASIPIMDVLTKMFNEGKSCILKMNPVNAYLGMFIEEAFREAIEKDFLAVVYGRVEEAKYLLKHKEVDEVHITGSNKTHDYIFWGPPGPERAERMARNNPVINKESTSALGNVSPVIIYPGEYTQQELEYQAEDIAGALGFNSGFMCSVPVSLVTWNNWPQRDLFLNLLEQKIQKLEKRRAYYPGAYERWETANTSGMSFKLLGETKNHTTPWIFARGLKENNHDMQLFKQEPFCSVLAETVIDAENTADYLEKAVNFVNEKLWGTLTASLIIDPRSETKSAIATQLEKAINELEYGTIAINSSFTALSFMTATAAWGAYPGSVLSNIQSGNGWLHNTTMIEDVEKMVARFPIKSSRKPFYFPSHKKKLQLVQKLIDHEINQKWNKVPLILLDMVFA